MGNEGMQEIMGETEEEEKLRLEIINDPKIKALRISIEKNLKEGQLLAHQLVARVSELQEGRIYTFNIEVWGHKADQISSFSFPGRE